MALISRISRLFQADMHAVLDQIEEPELLLRQSIREMEESLAQHETQIKLADLEQQQLAKKEQQIKQILIELDNQLQLCFKSGKDELAQGLVKQKLEITQSLKRVTENYSNQVEHSKQLNSTLSENQAQLNSMKQKAELFSTDKNQRNHHYRWHEDNFNISDEQVEIAFLQEKQNWEHS